MSLKFKRLEVGAGAGVVHGGWGTEHGGAGCLGSEAVDLCYERVLRLVLHGLRRFDSVRGVSPRPWIFILSVDFIPFLNRVERCNTEARVRNLGSDLPFANLLIGEAVEIVGAWAELGGQF